MPIILLIVLSVICCIDCTPLVIHGDEDHHITSIHYDVLNQSLLLNFNQNQFLIELTKNDHFFTTIDTPGGSKYMYGVIFRDSDPVGWASIIIDSHNIIKGIMTLEDTTYQIQYTNSLYKLKLIGTNDGKLTSNHGRMKRHDHIVNNGTIEVALVVDETAMSYHDNNDNDVRTYLLELMNTVSHLFRHPSLEANVKISISDIRIFEDNELKLLNDTDAKSHRDTFCNWKFNKKIKGDIAVLLTRRSICESTNGDASCGIVGITNLGSMCKPSSSCSVIKDTGYSTSFTIAHEIGHSLGLLHDGNENCNQLSNDNQPQHYIMASSFEASDNPHIWSTCSKQKLHEFFSSSQSNCLKNIPSVTVNQFSDDVLFLGKNYSLDHQCTLLFGKQAKACLKTNCSSLWCTLDDGNTCVHTQYSPPLAGSPCSINNNNNNTICYHGECIGSELVMDTAIHGQWSNWSPWSECTTSCGNGLQHSSRLCNSPVPKFSGKFCEGARKRYRMCNKGACPTTEKSYRQKKCEELGSTTSLEVGGHSFENEKWTTVDEKLVTTFGYPCKLYCQKESKPGLFVAFGHVVSNGVSCYTQHHFDQGLCIDGNCVKVGCGNNLNTPTYTDVCGVQCGDNSTCVVIDHTFALQGNSMKTVTIPSGAKDISIEGIIGKSSSNIVIEDDMHHVLVDASVAKYDHSYVAGGLCWYSVTSVHCKGPINHSIKVKISSTKSEKSDWVYSFIAPSSYTEYTWDIVQDWSKCSKVCGDGTQERTVVCKRNGKISDDKYCDGLSRPQTTKTCHLDDCENYEWYSGEWSKCNTGCGSGHKVRNVMCKNIITNETASEEYCPTTLKPDERAVCNSNMHCPEWVYSVWSQCSVTCGTGQQTRLVQCAYPNGTIAASTECDQKDKPISHQSCSLSECVQVCLGDTLPSWACLNVKKHNFCNQFNKQCCKTCTI